jgi:hypothetical protein
MNRFALVALALSAAACGPSQPAGASAAATTAAPVAAPATAEATAGATAGGDVGTVSGVVAETMNSGGYTYARLTADGQETWVAASEFPLKVGDTVQAVVDMPMEKFHSRTLNRDFPVIYFVRDVALNGSPLPVAAASAASAASVPAMAGSHDRADPLPPAPSLIAPVAPVPGGVKALSGQPIVIRGQVMKVNYEIMGTNWYHLQDGSGVVADGTHDLVVTSSAQMRAGDIVTVSGVLAVDKDFGAGYAYEAIIERADIKK